MQLGGSGSAVGVTSSCDGGCSSCGGGRCSCGGWNWIVELGLQSINLLLLLCLPGARPVRSIAAVGAAAADVPCSERHRDAVRPVLCGCCRHISLRFQFKCKIEIHSAICCAGKLIFYSIHLWSHCWGGAGKQQMKNARKRNATDFAACAQCKRFDYKKKIKHRHDYHTSWTYKLVEAQSFHRVYVQNKTVNAIIRQAAPTQGDLRSPMRANFQNVPNKLQRMHIKLNIIQ